MTKGGGSVTRALATACDDAYVSNVQWIGFGEHCAPVRSDTAAPADHEQEHHHPELRDMQDGLGIREQSEHRPHQHAGGELAQNRAEAEPPEQRHGNDGGRHKNHRRSNHLPQARFSHQVAFSVSCVAARTIGATSVPRSSMERFIAAVSSEAVLIWKVMRETPPSTSLA